MYGDTVVMRKRAAQLREQGEDIRRLAEHLVARSDEIDWAGRAADDMRARVRDRAAHLREAAHAHDTAAASLERHLAECERLTEAIARVERRASSLVADARTRLARVPAPTAPAREDQALVAFTPPPPGHKDWLDVEIPGV